MEATNRTNRASRESLRATDTANVRQAEAGLGEMFAEILELLRLCESHLAGKRPKRGNVQRKALAAIVTMRAEGRKITIASVADECGAARNSLYHYPSVIEAIEAAKAGPGVRPRRGHRSADGGIEAYDDGECDS